MIVVISWYYQLATLVLVSTVTITLPAPDCEDVLFRSRFSIDQVNSDRFESKLKLSFVLTNTHTVHEVLVREFSICNLR